MKPPNWSGSSLLKEVFLNTRVDRAGHPPLQDDEEHTDSV